MLVVTTMCTLPVRMFASSLLGSDALVLCSALLTVCGHIDTAGEFMLEAYKPQAYTETIGGRSMASAGCEPILHMRDFQRSGQMPEGLVQDILSRAGQH